jgi:hypothetical protein
MVAIAVGLVWVSYTGTLYGYCLVRGYNITPKQLLSTKWPPGKPTTKSGPQGGSGLAPGAGVGGGAGGGGGGSF